MCFPFLCFVSFHLIAMLRLSCQPYNFKCVSVCVSVCLTASDQMTTPNRLNQTKYNAMFTSIIFFFLSLVVRSQSGDRSTHAIIISQSVEQNCNGFGLFTVQMRTFILCAHAIYCGPLICVVYVYASDFIAVAYNWQFSVSSLNG